LDANKEGKAISREELPRLQNICWNIWTNNIRKWTLPVITAITRNT